MDFIDIYQHEKLRRQAGEIRDAQRTADRTADDILELTDAVDRLALAAKAMWELICERTELTDEDLLERVRDIDLRDGKLDGKTKTKTPPLVCTGCARPNSARRKVCMYCGEELPPQNPLG